MPSGLILPFAAKHPVLAEDVFLAPGAILIGDITIGTQSSIWFNCVLRGDVQTMRIGARVNIQDGTVVHVSRRGAGTQIGDDVSIGHSALIHGCTLESGSFVGMDATVMDNAVIESGAMLAAGALLPPGKRIPAGELWAGRPAKLLRKMSEEDIARLRSTAQNYINLSRQYLSEGVGRPPVRA